MTPAKKLLDGGCRVAATSRNAEALIEAVGEQSGNLLSLEMDLLKCDKRAGEEERAGEVYYVQVKSEWLNKIARLIDKGQVKVIIAKVYPSEQVAEAHRESETGHARGKLVLEVKKSN